ncbi:MAG: hypothetical protein K2F81_01445 [Ruminococcus sp.]|nr:hypothetical protein [Ruminococcus sp.]
MEIKNINLTNCGYIYCKSCFYSCQDGLREDITYQFSVGVNNLVGEIDSGNWGISCLISMYPYFSPLEKGLVFLPHEAMVNGETWSLSKLSKYSCYLDEQYPLFNTKKTVKKLVAQGLKSNKSTVLPESIRDMFHIDLERFERPLSGVGNEVFRAMAAIGYSHGKQVYCFPWLSKMRFDYYHGNMTDLLSILESLQKIVILPVGK